MNWRLSSVHGRLPLCWVLGQGLRSDEASKSRAESWNVLDGVRRCQRLPEVTHPVDSTRPAGGNQVPCPATLCKNRPKSAPALTIRRPF